MHTHLLLEFLHQSLFISPFFRVNVLETQTDHVLQDAKRRRRYLALVCFGYVAFWWSLLPTILGWIIGYWLPMPLAEWFKPEVWFSKLLIVQVLIIVPYWTVGLLFMVYFLLWGLALLRDR
jgi:hypothetical protein